MNVSLHSGYKNKSERKCIRQDKKRFLNQRSNEDLFLLGRQQLFLLPFGRKVMCLSSADSVVSLSERKLHLFPGMLLYYFRCETLLFLSPAFSRNQIGFHCENVYGAGIYFQLLNKNIKCWFSRVQAPQREHIRNGAGLSNRRKQALYIECFRRESRSKHNGPCTRLDKVYKVDRENKLRKRFLRFRFTDPPPKKKIKWQRSFNGENIQRAGRVGLSPWDPTSIKMRILHVLINPQSQ